MIVYGFLREAERFERKYGLHGISRVYQIPDNLYIDFSRATNQIARARLLGTAIEKWYNSDFEHHAMKVQEILQGLINSNRELAEALHYRQPFSPEEAMVIIRGVTSGYNSQDIAYFIDRDRRATAKNGGVCPEWDSLLWNDPEIDPAIHRRQVLERRVNMDWIPSPETTEEITRQLDRRLQEKRRIIFNASLARPS